MLSQAFMRVIRFYQRWIAPALPPACRFYPSCSHYALGAYERFGALGGSWLTFVRLLKCQPFHPGGYDPVPQHLKYLPLSRPTSSREEAPSSEKKDSLRELPSSDSIL